jgi:hypothetical protein
MVYTRSSKRNALKIIESLETQNNKLKNKNNILETKNSELEEEVARLMEEKNKLIKKYEPTSVKGAVNRILDLVSMFPECYHEWPSHKSFYDYIYHHIAHDLQLDYECIIDWYTTNDERYNCNKNYNCYYNILTEEEIESLKNGIIFKKYTEFYNKHTSTKPPYIKRVKYFNGKTIEWRNAE